MDLFTSIAFFGIASAIITALIFVDIPLPFKFIIAGMILFIWLLLKLLFTLYEMLADLILYNRLNFISNEKRRLEPDNQIPAWDILASDLKEEKEFKEIRRVIAGFSGSFTRILFWFALAILGAGVAAVVYFNIR